MQRFDELPKKQAPRSHFEVLLDILLSLRSGPKIPYRLMNAVGSSWNTFTRDYIPILQKSGLISKLEYEKKDYWALTDEGCKVLNQSQDLLTFLNQVRERV